MYEKTLEEIKLRRSINNLQIIYRLENEKELFKDFILNCFAKDQQYSKVFYYNMKDNQEEMIQRLLDKDNKHFLKEKETEELSNEKVLIVFDEIQEEIRMLPLLKQYKEDWNKYHVIVIGYNRNINCYQGDKLINGDVAYCEYYPEEFNLILNKPEYNEKYPRVSFTRKFIT